MIHQKVRLQSDEKSLLPPEYMALKFFQDQPHSTLTNFAEEIHVQKPTATVLITRLITKGLLKRVRCAQDHRAYELELTKKGIETLNRAEEIFEEHAGVLFAALTTSEQKQLIQLLNKLVDHA